jgi:glyoxylase-like metal-dependent hydrolase (beta-lactamase superfamily II)
MHIDPLPECVRVFERGWLSSNNILFLDDAPTLIDSGYCIHAPQTLALVQSALGGKPLARLLNTHLHSDHCGGNAAFQATYHDLQTLVPPGESAIVAAWNEDQLTYRATGQECPRFSFTGLLNPGETVILGGDRWDVLAAPGHDPHSVILHCPAHGILISADALWENGFGVVFPELEGEDAFAAVRDTLDLISRLSVRTVIPGHGAPFTDLAGALARAYRRIDGFIANPRKHALHAVKVLVMFRMLIDQSRSQESLAQLLCESKYFLLLDQHWFGVGVNALVSQTCDELVTNGQLLRTNGMLNLSR